MNISDKRFSRDTMEMCGEDETRLISGLVLYLDHTGQLTRISGRLKEEAKALSSSSVHQLSRTSVSSLNDSFNSSSSSVFPNGNHRMFQIQVEINVILMADFHEDLAEMIMTDKKEFLELLQFVIYRFSTTLEEEVVCKPSQIVLTPVISGLAPCSDHEVRCRTELSQVTPGYLMSATVMVVGLGLTVKYVSSTSYHCTSEDCEEFRDDTEYVKVFSPVGESKEHFQCSRCEGRLEEQYRRRDVREVVPGLVTILGEGEGSSSRVVSAVFRGEDGAGLQDQLGQRMLIVFTVETSRSGDLILEVYSTEPFSPPPSRPSADSKILQLLRNRQWSAWSFVSSLAYVFCENLVPPGTFMQLRLALLLSLVSGPEERLNVLAVGDEDLIFSQLMSEATLAAGGEIYCSNISLSGSLCKGKLSYLEGGQLHRARDSVLYLGDVTAIRQSARETLVKAVETRTVTSPPPMASSQPLTTALWALASTSSVKPKRDHDSRLISVLSNILDFSSSMDLILVSSDMSEDCGEILASFYLELTEESNKISMEEITAYLDYVKQVTVNTPEDCKEYLRRYFLASRRVRPNCPQSAMMTLLKIATSHARLAARNEVLQEDCVFACHFYEDMMTNLTGYSYLGHDAKSPVVGDSSLDSLLGTGHEIEMRDFKISLEKFIFESYSFEDPEIGEDDLATEE